MSFTVEVGLLSGKATTLKAHQDEQVEALKLRGRSRQGSEWRLPDIAHDASSSSSL